jgi:hypothetical protein
MSTLVVTAGSTRILGPEWIVPRPESHRENTEAYALVTLLPAVGSEAYHGGSPPRAAVAETSAALSTLHRTADTRSAAAASPNSAKAHTLLQESQPNARKRGRDAGVNRRWHAPLPHRPPCLPMARVAGCTSLHDVHCTLSFACCRWAYLHHDRLLRRQPRREPQAPIVLCSEVCANQSLCWRITHSDRAGAVLAAMPSTLHIANV